LLSSIGGNKDLLNMASGLADGYTNYQETKIKEPYYEALTGNAEANANSTNVQTQQLEQRMANMQAQPDVGLGVNPNAQVFNKTPGSTAGKVAVVMNGEVKYLSQAEYDALRAQQSSGPSGLITTGGQG
jgi:hypothetical protein